MAFNREFRNRHCLSLSLTAISFLLLALLAVVDAKFELYRHASGRYRVHAIPVALSQIYHGRPHDYTAFMDVAFGLREAGPLNDLIAKYADPNCPVGNETYFWTADDRGLSDYVNGAFRLFGAKIESLACFYYVLLGGSLLLFAIGYWREPLVLLAPVLVMFGLLVYAHTLLHYSEVILGDGIAWQEAVSLYETRTFESIAILAWLHLGLLAWRRQSNVRLTWLTALPQALLLIFLYHARSSLGWMYLALFVLASLRLSCLAWIWLRREWPGREAISRPLIVASILLGSLVSLNQYKHATYHPDYFLDRGSRTFWHNALMGFGYHPQLRETLDVGIDDTKVIVLVLRKMKERDDSRLDETWTLANIGGALGSKISFDWRAFEAAARDTYLDVWRDQPGEAFVCYSWYKPRDIGIHSRQLARLLVRDLRHGRANYLGFAIGMMAIVVMICGWISGRDPVRQQQWRSLQAPCLLLLLFSLIPAIAFYAAIPTLSGFYVTLAVVVGLGLVRLFSWLSLLRVNVLGDSGNRPKAPLIPQINLAPRMESDGREKNDAHETK